MIEAISASSQKRIETLQSLLKDRPRNAKLLAELAQLTSDIDMARLAVELAPNKPFGYAALSVLVTHPFERRLEHLRRSVECTQNRPQHGLARYGLLVRLLVEPRQHEAKQTSCQLSKGHNRHPSRRPLNASETATLVALHTTRRELDVENLNDSQRRWLGTKAYKLGCFFRKVDPKLSAVYFEDAVRHCDPLSRTGQLASFWLATLQQTNQQKSLDRCPPSYITGLYAGFAARFDKLLVEKLHYQTPTKLQTLLAQALPNVKFEKMLDLGCGTGLSGLAFANVSKYRVGVDLSAEMMDRARKRSIYNELIVGDVTSQDNMDTFDLVIACDVFCYLGNLEPVFAQLTAVGSVFCFSVELLEEADEERQYKILSTARFSHKQSYVLSLAILFHFEVLGKQVCCIRKNQGVDVIGLLVVLRKGAR